MKFSTRVQNSPTRIRSLSTAGDKEQSLSIAPKPAGGSSVSGGELLLLALATCYCNDIYREAAKRNIKVKNIEVEVTGDSEAEGKPACNIVSRAKMKF